MYPFYRSSEPLLPVSHKDWTLLILAIMITVFVALTTPGCSNSAKNKSPTPTIKLSDLCLAPEALPKELVRVSGPYDRFPSSEVTGSFPFKQALELQNPHDLVFNQNSMSYQESPDLWIVHSTVYGTYKFSDNSYFSHHLRATTNVRVEANTETGLCPNGQSPGSVVDGIAEYYLTQKFNTEIKPKPATGENM